MENDKLLGMLNTMISLKEEMNKNNVRDVKENDMLYTLTFIALIRNGMDFSIISKVIGKKEEKKSFFSISTSQKEDELITKDYIEIKTMMGDFNCSVNNVRNILGDDEYNKIILKLSDKPKAAKKDFDLFEYDETIGMEQVEQPVEEEPEEIVEEDEQPGNSATRLPFFYEDKKLDADYPGKKYLSTMLYHIHAVDTEVNGVSLKAIFTVYPIKVTADDPATDIAVTATLFDPVTKAYSAPRGAVSRGKSASVNIDFDDAVFVIHGTWERGKFKSYVRSTKKHVEIITDKLTEHIPEKNRTSTTFMKIREFDDINVYVFPAVIGENTADGYIIGSIAVENPSQNTLSVLCPTSNGEFIVVSNNVEYALGVYWQGSTADNLVLVYNIDEAEY